MSVEKSIEEILKQMHNMMNSKTNEFSPETQLYHHECKPYTSNNNNINKMINDLGFNISNSRNNQNSDDIFIEPSKHYNLSAIQDSDGNVLAKTVTILCVGGYSKNISVTTESISGSDDFYLIISRTEDTGTDPYLDVANELLSKGSLVRVRSTFEAVLPFTLRLRIGDNMDPESIKCNIRNGILECFILAKKAKKPKVRKISIDELN